MTGKGHYHFMHHKILLLMFKILALILLSELVGSAQAASSSRQSDTPMQVFLVHDAGEKCAPDCGDWIAAQGRITPDAVAQFRGLLKTLGPRKLPVLLHSLGGDVNAAMTMGRLIRAHGFDVAVMQTVFIPYCKPDNAPCNDHRGPVQGRFEPNLSYCLSACPLILAGGVHRFAASRSFVGVHQITAKMITRYVRNIFEVTRQRIDGKIVEISRRLLRQEPVRSVTTTIKAGKTTTNEVAAYLRLMGIDAAIMKPMLDTPAKDMHLLSRAEEDETKIVTDHEIITVKGENPAPKT